MPEHNHNLEILESIVENTEMGKNTLDQMIPLTDDPRFKAELLREKNVYHEMNSKAHQCMEACGGQAKGQSGFAKANTRMAIQMKTVHDKSTRNLAKMLAMGNEQGVMDCIETRSDYPEAAPGTMQLSQELQDFQEECRAKMNEFLG